MANIRQARVLIDWNNIQARVDADFLKNPRKNIPPLVLRIQQQAARALTIADATCRYRAVLRIYYGWHQKRDATPIRKEFERYALDESLARTIGTVSYTAGFEFGNELCCYDERKPLYDTYRGKGQESGQKMVDTAITSDLLHLGRLYPDMSVVVVSDDDDFLPAIMTANAWRTNAILLRAEHRDLKLVTDETLDDLLYYWSEA